MIARRTYGSSLIGLCLQMIFKLAPDRLGLIRGTVVRLASSTRPSSPSRSSKGIQSSRVPRYESDFVAVASAPVLSLVLSSGLPEIAMLVRHRSRAGFRALTLLFNRARTVPRVSTNWSFA